MLIWQKLLPQSVSNYKILRHIFNNIIVQLFNILLLLLLSFIKNISYCKQGKKQTANISLSWHSLNLVFKLRIDLKSSLFLACCLCMHFCLHILFHIIPLILHQRVEYEFQSLVITLIFYIYDVLVHVTMFNKYEITICS